MQLVIEEYLAKANVFADNEEELRNFQPELGVEVLGYVDLNYPLHIFLLYQIDDLATVCNDFERRTCHRDLRFLEDLPISEPCHDSCEYLIKVFIHRRVLVAELLRLVKQVLAQQVALLLNHLSNGILICRVIFLAQLVLLLNLLDDAVSSFLAPCLSLAEPCTMAYACRCPLCAVI